MCRCPAAAMPKKKGSAKGKKGGKKGSAKGKKGSAKGKKAAAEDAPPPEPELVWPWVKAAEAWMSRAPSKREKLRRHFRDHYIYSEAIICTQQEWVRSLSAYQHPYADADVEAMVQILVTLLCNEGTRKEAPDNYRLFAAALR